MFYFIEEYLINIAVKSVNLDLGIKNKLKKTVKEKYDVDNVFQIQEIINSTRNIDRNTKKAFETKKTKYSNGAFDNEKMKNTIFENHGVTHYSKTPQFREIASKTIIETMDSKKMYKIRTYKETELYYQSTYELKFLELCESIGIINEIKRSKTYKYSDNSEFGHRFLPDFVLEKFNIVVEIKSSYFYFGREKKFEEIKRIVELSGKKYMMILDNNFTEFETLIKSI